MNTPVKSELAKFLKEKGFNLYCNCSYWKGELTPNTPGYALEDGTTSQKNYYDFERYYAPTIAEVVMWLYEKHGIWINVKKNWNDGICLGFEAIIDSKEGFVNCGTFKSPTEAYEAAIKFTLKNKLP